MNNDKIKQLAEDAGYCYAPVDEGYENRDSYNCFDYKEFALLILEECITICDEYTYDYVHSRSADKIYNDIIDRFGIEK